MDSGAAQRTEDNPAADLPAPHAGDDLTTKSAEPFQPNLLDDQGNPIGSVSDLRLELYKGPLPHPQMLREYNEIVPGMAKALLENFQAESEHRRTMDKFRTTASDRERMDILGAFRLSTVAGSVVTIALLIGIILLFMYDKNEAAYVLLALIVGFFSLLTFGGWLKGNPFKDLFGDGEKESEKSADKDA